jgi:tryptophan synthase alpha chain
MMTQQATPNRIDALFASGKTGVLNVYCTAGYPEADSTLPVMQALQDSGADMIELGMPYSDPLADGPVIQASSMVAIEKGMTVARLLDQLKDFRKTIRVPVLLMGYLNPVLQYGFERFCRDAAAVGIDGLILPDLPMHEFEILYGPIIRKYGLHFIFLVTPETSPERIRRLDMLSTGFLYAVSSSSTTGGSKDMGDSQVYFRRLADMRLANPVLVGFGIRDRATFVAACAHTNGAIIGTAYIKVLQSAAEAARLSDGAAQSSAGTSPVSAGTAHPPAAGIAAATRTFIQTIRP